MSCVIDVHAQSGGFFAQTGHSHDVPREDDEETRARGRSDPADLEGPSRRRAEGALVIAQAELRLRDADREAVEAGGPVLHRGGAIDRRGDLRDLLLERVRVFVGEAHGMGRGLRRIDHEAGEFLPAGAAVLVERVRGRSDAEVLAVVDYRVDLAIRVRHEAIHRDDRGHAEGLQDPHVGVEVDHAGLEDFRVLDGQVLPLRPAVMLEGADAHDEHRGVRSQAALAAHEVHELLRPEVRAEACLRDDDVPEAEGEAVREDGIVAVGDVREGPAVHEGGRPLQGLDQVRHQRVLQEDRRGPVDVEVPGADGMLLAVEGDHDPLEAGLEVRDALREAEDRHDLARGGDDEPVLPRHAVLRTAEARHDVPQLAVVHVEAPREQDAGRVDVELVPVEDVRVQDRRDQVVRRADGVDVPGEVEVDLLHRQDLGTAATRRAAFRPGDRPEGRLADGDDPLRSEAIQRLAEADRGQRLSLPVAGRGRAGDEDELALPTLSDSIDRRELDFRDEVALQDEVVPRQAEVLGDVDDRPHLRRLRDFDVRDHYRGNCRGAKRIFFASFPFGNGGKGLSRYTNLVALAGIDIGILGLIIAAGSPDVSRQYGAALAGGLLAWVIGGLFLVGAYFEAKRPD